MLITEDIGEGWCFHCGQPVVEKGIFWHSGENAIRFHGECAAHFAIRFMRDIHEYELRHGSVVASRKSLDRFPQ